MKKTLVLIALCVPLLSIAGSVHGHFSASPDRDSTKAIPADPALRTGKLANGFTYYIRRNTEPQKRVQFYLVNKVGSILEDEDQRGLAHFIEHMSFNGTKHFPKNSMVDYLQKAGVRFGADLNAHTGFDETVYELPIPTSDPAMVTGGLNIMRDWAQDATFDLVELNKERGVVLEEKRLGMGAQERLSRIFTPIMTEQSRYASRLPIGLENVITSFKPETIKQFYHDWYRPDLQALVVVGDIDVDEMEKMIRQKFSDLKNPVNERVRKYDTLTLTGQSHFTVATDKEVSTTSLDVIYKHKASEVKTEGDYLEHIRLSLFNELLSRRFSVMTSPQANPAYLGASANIKPFLGGLDMLSFSVNAKSGMLKESVMQSWQIVEQIKRYGFTQDELDMVRKNFLASIDRSLKEESKIPSSSYVREYQDQFLHNSVSPGLDWEADFIHQHISKVSLHDMQHIIDAYMGIKTKDIFITAPEKDKAALPDSATAAAWLKDVAQMNVLPYKDKPTNGALLTTALVPGRVVEKHTVPEINLTILKLSNGLTVVMKPTDFRNDEILFKGFGPGGTSVYNDQDYESASVAANLIGRFGLGDHNAEELNNLINGKIMNVSAGIGARSATISGLSSQADLETALQIAYLQMTSPRKDSLLFQNAINKFKESIQSRYVNPNNVFADTISGIMARHNQRFSPPTIEKLNQITLQKVYDIYKATFADASGFTFVFVGNFSPDAITPLITHYLGSLPATYKKTQARDLHIPRPAGRLVTKVYQGSEDKATVRIVIPGSYDYNPLNNLILKALQDILQIKVIQHLREDESEVYSPTVGSSYAKDPDNRYSFTVSFGCAPKNADHLVAMVEKELANLRDNGPGEDDVQKFKIAYAKSLELALSDNAFWMNYLTGQYEYKDDLLQVLDIQNNVDKITAGVIRNAAGKYLSGKDFLVFELFPETSKQK